MLPPSHATTTDSACKNGSPDAWASRFCSHTGAAPTWTFPAAGTFLFPADWAGRDIPVMIRKRIGNNRFFIEGFFIEGFFIEGFFIEGFFIEGY
jgi:hypothetical protein